MDILDLPGWRLLEAPLDGDGYRLVAEFLAEPDTCQRCGVIGRLYRHGTHAARWCRTTGQARRTRSGCFAA